MASDEGLSRDESRQMRDIGRQAMSQVVGVALKQAVSHDLLRTFAVVSKVNRDGTVDLECGSEETPMPLDGVRLTLGCSTVEVGDTVVVDTYDHSPLVVSVLYSNASSGHTVASKPEVNAARSAADQALSEAKTAKAASDAAQESAESAKESADAATESAKTAQAKADAATESAATAQSKAEDAGNAATKAQSDADSAKTAATAAQAKADEAATAAATAQSKADTASTAAATAQSKAEDATASANAAGRAASNAQAAAEAAQGDIDSQRTYFWHDSDGSHVLGEQDGYRSDVRADGLHVLSAKDSSELAKFTSSGSQLGADNKAHQSMDYHSWRLVDADGVEFAHISDLRDENGEYQVEEVGAGINADNAGGGYFQYLSHPLKRIVSVEIHQISTTKKATIEYTLGQYDGHYYGIRDAIDTVTCSAEAIRTALIAAGVEPDSDYAAQIHYTYITSDPRMKAFTFGGRSTGSEIGGNSMTIGIDSSATGLASVAMGCGSHAGNDFSAAIGGYVTTNTQNQVAVGRGNKVDSKYAFMVGNGTGPGENFGIASWSNAFAVDWSGNGEFQGGMALGTPLPVASGGTGANTASAAFKNLSGYTLDLGTNNTYDTWVPVITNNSTIQHRVLPALPLPVSSGGTGATDAAGARANLAVTARNGNGLTNAWVGIWNGNTSDPGYRLETCWFVNGVQRGLCVDTYNRLRFYGANVNNWSLGNLSGSKDMVPVYRLYNQYNGQHLFVSSESEYNSLVSQGWTGEGIVFYAFK